MKNKFPVACFMAGALLTSFFVYADADMDRLNPSTLVKDSVITTKIKAKLATEHFASLTKINVDTDQAGSVWLTGAAATQAEADRAVAIARETDGVVAIKSDITIKPVR